jgi:HEAT repeat protein
MAYSIMDFGGGGSISLETEVTPIPAAPSEVTKERFPAAVEQATVDRLARLLHGSGMATLPRSTAEAADAPSAAKPPVWLAQLLASSKAETRLRGVELCAKNADPAYLEFLVNALDDPDATVRERAAAGLSQFEEGVLVERVLLALSTPGGRMGDHLPALRRQAAPRMLELLQDESAPATRRQLAAHGLGAMGETRALETLGPLAQSGDYPMAYVCARAMLALRAPEALPYWLELSTHDDEQLRAMALDGLAESGGDQAFDRLLAVASGDGESGPWLQMAAVRYIGEQPAQTAVPALVQVMEQNDLMRPDAGRLLTKFTGWEFGNDPALWRAWLENPQQFMPQPEEDADNQAPVLVEESPLETLGTF